MPPLQHSFHRNWNLLIFLFFVSFALFVVKFSGRGEWICRSLHQSILVYPLHSGLRLSYAERSRGVGLKSDRQSREITVLVDQLGERAILHRLSKTNRAIGSSRCFAGILLRVGARSSAPTTTVTLRACGVVCRCSGAGGRRVAPNLSRNCGTGGSLARYSPRSV